MAALVNRLRDIAVKFKDTQQLRERIAAEIRPVAHSLAAPPKAEQVPRIVAPFPGMDDPWPEEQKQRLREVCAEVFGWKSKAVPVPLC